MVRQLYRASHPVDFHFAPECRQLQSGKFWRLRLIVVVVFPGAAVAYSDAAEACPLAEAGQPLGLLRWRRAGELLAVVLGVAAVRNGSPAFPVFASGACLAWR